MGKQRKELYHSVGEIYVYTCRRVILSLVQAKYYSRNELQINNQNLKEWIGMVIHGF